jgi:peptide/nickel transport system substrate-binding protein
MPVVSESLVGFFLGRFLPGIFLMGLMIVSSCSKREKIPADTLVVGIESEVRNLDLRTTADANSAHIVSLYAQSLIRSDERLLPITDLAKSFSTKDYKTYVFELPEGATFHDGSVLDCEDVIASFEQAASPKSRMKSSFQYLKEFRCPNPYRFEIELTIPLVRFLSSEISIVRIQPKEFANMEGLAPPIGSGPYVYVGKNYRDLRFTRFDNLKRYRDGQLEEPYSYKHLVVRTLADPSIRWLSIVAGDIDALLNALSPLRVLDARRSDRVRVYQAPGTTFTYVAINLKNPKFQDLRVRQALFLAVNREEIIKHKLFGMATIANSVISPVNFFHHAGLKGPAFDPVKARKLLSEAGKLGLEIELKTSTDADAVANMMVLTQQLRDAGFTVKLRSHEFGTFFSDVTKGNYELYSLRWTAVTDPDFLNRIFHSKEMPPGRNRVFYANSKVDRLLEAGAQEPDPQKRQKLYFEVQEIVLHDLPYIPLWFPDNVAVLGASINGFVPHPTGSWENLLRSWKGHDPIRGSR